MLSTLEINQSAHNALHPVWLACAEVFAGQPDTYRFDGTAVFESEGGAVVTRSEDGVVTLETEFETVLASGKTGDESVVVRFPLDCRDLSETVMERTTDFDDGRSSGGVSRRQYRQYASLLLQTLEPKYL